VHPEDVMLAKFFYQLFSLFNAIFFSFIPSLTLNSKVRFNYRSNANLLNSFVHSTGNAFLFEFFF